MAYRLPPPPPSSVPANLPLFFPIRYDTIIFYDLRVHIPRASPYILISVTLSLSAPHAHRVPLFLHRTFVAIRPVFLLTSSSFVLGHLPIYRVCRAARRPPAFVIPSTARFFILHSFQCYRSSFRRTSLRGYTGCMPLYPLYPRWSCFSLPLPPPSSVSLPSLYFLLSLSFFPLLSPCPPLLLVLPPSSSSPFLSLFLLPLLLLSPSSLTAPAHRHSEDHHQENVVAPRRHERMDVRRGVGLHAPHKAELARGCAGNGWQ
ncbi:hypothetical protein DFH06DRAFT_53658 [Mycena polygramma]|nr:hypothetical protein DFH06DRAFT_53658 [Mycena polygramma]